MAFVVGIVVGGRVGRVAGRDDESDFTVGIREGSDVDERVGLFVGSSKASFNGIF